MNTEEFENHFKTVFENSGTAGIIFEDKKVIMANNQCKDIFGYEPHEMIGKNVYDLVFAEDFRVFEECCEQGTCLEESIQKSEIRIKNSQNQVKFTFIKVASIPNTSKCYISFLDINDQRIVEKSLIKSQDNLNAIMESAFDGIITTDAEGKIVYTNPSFIKIFGYSTDEILGKSVSILMPERFRENFLSKMNVFQKTGEHFKVGKLFESKGLRKDGEEFPFEMSITYWKSGDERFQTSIVRDISDRVNAERNIKESEERLKDLFDNATDLIQMIKPDAGFLYVNKAWKDTLGYSDQDLEEMTVFDAIYPDHLDQCHTIFDDLKHGKTLKKVETGFKTKDGKEVIVEGNCNPKMDSDGNFLYTRAIFRDITESKKAETEIKRLASIVESSGDAIIGYDLDGIILNWNRSAEELYGYTADEIKGKKLSMVMKPDKWEENLINVEKIKKGESVTHFETSRLKKDGNEVLVSISLSPIKDIDGEIVGISAISRDITESKKAREELEASEEKYRKIVEKFIQNALALIAEINKI